MSESSVHEARQASEKFLSLCSHGAPQFNDVAAAVHSLCAAVSKAEAAGAQKATIRTAIQVAWDIHARSPFIHRLQTWPRGYAGDFETIEYLIGGANRAEPGTVEYWLEFIAIQSPIAQQHRNKVAWQAKEIRSALHRNDPSRPPKILILAAGSCPDIAAIEDEIAARECEIVINDADSNALAFSKKRLVGIKDRLRFVPGSVLTSGGKLSPFGPFELVMAGGLFDYLPDRHAEFLIRVVYDRLLAPGGRFFFTNIARLNPYRVWIEYLANWKLLERSNTDLRRLVAVGGGTGGTCLIERETTGLTWLVAMDKPIE